MRWMKKAAAAVMAMFVFLPVYAESSLSPKDAYETARKDYLCAWMSMAAYDDPISQLGRNMLVNEHWKLSKASVSDELGHARFLIAMSGDKEEKPLLILSVAGTTDYTDVKADLSFDKTLWDSSAAAPDKTQNLPKVHRGFKRYADSIWNTQLDTMTVSQILNRQASEGDILLTGHSLGGAVSTLLGVKMIDSGLNQHLEVVTFGAPAVGNPAFVNTYESLLPLKRIVNSGDPVQSVVQKVVKNYTQIGSEERWKPVEGSYYFSHRMMVYLDTAIRNYYDARDAYEKSGGHIPENIPASPPSIFILPLQVTTDDALASDIPYMKKITADYYQRQLPGALMGTEGKTTEEALSLARQNGCRYTLENELTARTIPSKNNEIQITFMQTLRTVDGHVISYSEYRMLARDMTPIEAALYVAAKVKPSI